jgi:hypothetical protein
MKISRVKIKDIESDIASYADSILNHSMMFNCRGIEWGEIIDQIRLEISKLDIKLTELEEYVDSTEEVL